MSARLRSPPWALSLVRSLKNCRTGQFFFTLTPSVRARFYILLSKKHTKFCFDVFLVRRRGLRCAHGRTTSLTAVGAFARPFAKKLSHRTVFLHAHAFGSSPILYFTIKKTHRILFRCVSGAPPGARTPDTLIKSQVLYQLS